MKIGILTFHWATNYGAILQCYALQTYLELLGHEVYVINYKPKIYDIKIFNVLRPRNLCHSFDYLRNYSKEHQLKHFRNSYLHLTKRIFSEEDFNSLGVFDIVFSGSDQVLNPSFTLIGEGKPCSAYYLNKIKSKYKFGYAVSFGCKVYPKDAIIYAKQWINSFDSISVREETGLAILESLSFHGGKQLVPDPTLLLGASLFDKVPVTSFCEKFIYVYLLHGKTLPSCLQNVLQAKIVIAEEDGKFSMENWLGRIKCSNILITNSYHGMIMSILFHVPFVVILNEGALSGMNDRFYSLLDYLELSYRIVNEIDNKQIQNVIETDIDWKNVDAKLEEFSKIGKNYLNNCLSYESIMAK